MRITADQARDFEARGLIPPQPKRKAAHTWGKMNKTEARYHARLAAMRPQARIWFEAVTLKLGHDCRYTPDFMVQEPGLLGHSIAFHEVKGGRKREDAMVKLRVAATAFPLFAFYLCEFAKGEWNVRLVPGAAAERANG